MVQPFVFLVNNCQNEAFLNQNLRCRSLPFGLKTVLHIHWKVINAPEPEKDTSAQLKEDPLRVNHTDSVARSALETQGAWWEPFRNVDEHFCPFCPAGPAESLLRRGLPGSQGVSWTGAGCRSAGLSSDLSAAPCGSRPWSRPRPLWRASP
ncbi:unnamed protein product [Pleuronectes platessa]|uniref:Uncharacterized protein n=1 Tax=Pleuronectes platessa TaxID=8262 RepID=A0A9N7ZB61_PLEPL|nr:unnamed protein product [Pleuronectes platessa]